MKDGFTPQQLAKMRDEYGKISTIDPSGPAYKQLIAMLDKMHVDNLKTLAGAKIKFVSGLAQNRVNRAAMKKEEIEQTDEACWDTHKQEGMKKKGDKMVPNCVPKTEAASPAQQAAIAIAMKKAGKKPKDMKNEEQHPEDVKTPANKQEPEGTKKWLATTLKKLKNKDIKEAEGGGTSIRTTGDAQDAVKRAQVLLKSTQLRLKHEKEREAMAKQKNALQKEEEEKKKYPEFKSGGEPLAKKFEKAFAKMGIKTNIKMKTVGNVSINEKEDKKEIGKEASAKQKAVKKGETLSGKQEPIKIDPEISDNK